MAYLLVIGLSFPVQAAMQSRRSMMTGLKSRVRLMST